MMRSTNPIRPSRGALGAFALRTAAAVAATLATMIAVAVPGVRRQHHENVAHLCVLNLTNIENAKIRLMVDEQLAEGTTVTLERLVQACPQLLPEIPICPGGGSYEVGVIGGPVRCSLADQGHRIE